ncbi:hypothetical protein [Bradyrhizobium sp. USDA 3650]
MFGMLDYRAHKLFRLLSFPLIVCGRLTFFVVVAIAIIVAQQTGYSLLVKIVLAYVTIGGSCPFDSGGLVLDNVGLSGSLLLDR